MSSFRRSPEVMEYELQTLKSVADIIFDPHAGAEQASYISGILSQFQCNPASWSMVWQLLDEKMDWKSQVVGGLLLQAKVTTDLEELDELQLEFFREKLVNTILAHAALKTEISQKLAKKLTESFAAMMAKTMPFFFDGSVEGFMGNLISGSPVMSMEFFAALPQEVDRCETSVAHLSTLTASIVGICSRALENPLQSEAALRAIAQWVQLDDLNAMPVGLIPTLLGHMPSNLEFACDALLKSLHHPGWQTQPDALANHLVTVTDRFTVIIGAKKAQKNEEALCFLYTLLAELGIKHGYIVLKNLQGERKEAMRTFLTLLLECTATPGRYLFEETLSVIPLEFWKSLLNDLNRLKRDYQGDTSEIQQFLEPISEGLLQILVSKSRLLPVYTKSADREEEHKYYRESISKCYLFVYKVLSKYAVDFLLSQLELANAFGGLDRDWVMTEACLFALNSLGSSRVTFKGPLAQRTLDVMLQITGVNHPIATQVTAGIGIFAKEAPARSVFPSIHRLLSCLNDPNISSIAIKSLRALVKTHGDRMVPMANEILSVIRYFLRLDKRYLLTRRDRSRLVVTMAYLVTTSCSRKKKLTVLMTMMAPYLLEFVTATISSQQMYACKGLSSTQKEAHYCVVVGVSRNPGPSFDVMKHLAPQFVGLAKHHSESGQLAREFLDIITEVLNLLKCLFSALISVSKTRRVGSANLVQYMMKGLAPAFFDIALKCAFDSKIIDCMADCVRAAVPALKPVDECVLLVQIVCICCELLKICPSGALIDCATAIFMRCSKEELRIVGRYIKKLTLICLRNHTPAFNKNPDVVQAFFRMLTRFLQAGKRLITPEYFGDTLGDCLKYAMKSTRLPEPATFKCVITFLAKFVTASDKNDFVERILGKFGESLVMGLIDNMHGEVSRSLVDQQAKIFLAFKETNNYALARHLRNFPKAPRGLQVVGKEINEEFADRLTKLPADLEEVTKVIKEFSLEWRTRKRQHRQGLKIKPEDPEPLDLFDDLHLTTYDTMDNTSDESL